MRQLPLLIYTVQLCDEGINFYRLLLAADVDASCRELKGTMHSSELNHPFAIPEVALSTARAVADHTANGASLNRMRMPVAYMAGALPRL